MAANRLRDGLYSLYEHRIMRKLLGGSRQGHPEIIPTHVGIIIDGNRRWARTTGVSTRQGHQMGADKILELLDWCHDVGIEVVTLYVLSTENLSRPSEEVEALVEIISDLVARIATGNKWKVRLVGIAEAIPSELGEQLRSSVARTASHAGGTVNVAVGYGGRQEIVDAVKSLLVHRAEEGATLDEIVGGLTPDDVSEHLYTKGQPDPDLIIRTSGEQRLSGFLMWQSAYSEFYFCEAYWPDFRRTDFLRALRSYGQRKRRFGR